ncbi:hypothetical protein K2173_028105 [Erythroxylum novogranatense]|uniref:RNase III domain-containing protein n=1 Tax=Erythroxylum novogranatense TaxID=1862640 RepID=A0AAV8U3K4_9ROSI|nr:hypothetical protein K2173_028105 [Erythroxylum novogranatense]
MAFRNCGFAVFTLLSILILSYSQVFAGRELVGGRIKPSSSPFSSALEILQKQIGQVWFFLVFFLFVLFMSPLTAMTHSSFSEENNKALSILGSSVIDTSVSLHSLAKDIDMSPKIGVTKVVRVSPKTNSSMPSVVCGAFRAIFGAIAIDTGKSDDAETVFWSVHGGKVGKALSISANKLLFLKLIRSSSYSRFPSRIPVT